MFTSLKMLHFQISTSVWAFYRAAWERSLSSFHWWDTSRVVDPRTLMTSLLTLLIIVTGAMKCKEKALTCTLRALEPHRININSCYIIKHCEYLLVSPLASWEALCFHFCPICPVPLETFDSIKLKYTAVTSWSRQISKSIVIIHRKANTMVCDKHRRVPSDLLHYITGGN